MLVMLHDEVEVGSPVVVVVVLLLLSRSRLAECFMLLLSFTHSLPRLSFLLPPLILRLRRVCHVCEHGGSSRVHRTRRGGENHAKGTGGCAY